MSVSTGDVIGGGMDLSLRWGSKKGDDSDHI